MSRLGEIRQRNNAEHNAREEYFEKLQASHKELLATAKKLRDALETGYDELSRTWANFPDKPEKSHLDLLRLAIQNAEALKK